MNPAVFRDACLALFDYAEEWSAEHGEKFDLMMGGTMFMLNHFNARQGTEQAQEIYLNATWRFQQLSKFLFHRNVDLGELVRATDDGSKEVSLGLIEAAAVVPVRDGNMDVEDLIAEARTRVKQIDVLERLLGS